MSSEEKIQTIKAILSEPDYLAEVVGSLPRSVQFFTLIFTLVVAASASFSTDQNQEINSYVVKVEQDAASQSQQINSALDSLKTERLSKTKISNIEGVLNQIVQDNNKVVENSKQVQAKTTTELYRYIFNEISLAVCAITLALLCLLFAALVNTLLLRFKNNDLCKISTTIYEKTSALSPLDRNEVQSIILVEAASYLKTLGPQKVARIYYLFKNN